MKTLDKLLEKYKNKDKDGAFSEVTQLIIIIPLLFFLMITVADSAIFFANRSNASMAAQNGTRVAAVYGTTGSVNGNPIAKKYGVGKTAEEIVRDTINSTQLSMAKDIKVACGNKQGVRGAKVKAGEQVVCQVSYHYQGLGTPFSFVPHKQNIVIATSVSEVTVK